jgi:hypothetical protein
VSEERFIGNGRGALSVGGMGDGRMWDFLTFSPTHFGLFLCKSAMIELRLARILYSKLSCIPHYPRG